MPSPSSPTRTLYKQGIRNLYSRGQTHAGKKFAIWFYEDGKIDDFAWDWDEFALDEYLNKRQGLY